MNPTLLSDLLAPMDGNKERLAGALREARHRTEQIQAGFSDEALASAPCNYMSPPVWDLGHIANFEELWLVQNLGKRAEMHAGDNDRYNAFEHPREERPSLKLLDRTGALAYLAEVRDATLQVLARADTSTTAGRLTRDGFAYWMLVLHEHQHQETILQAAQMAPTYQPATVRGLPPGTGAAQAWCTIAAKEAIIGRLFAPGVYDNEAGEHRVLVPAFEMARFPVTCGEYLAFMEAGGYADDALWTSRGKAWRDECQADAPLYWRRDPESGAWLRRTAADGERAVLDVADEILCHVSFFEAEAFAAWSNARLPSEAEWEAAARAGSNRNPWGNGVANPAIANVDQLAFKPSQRGSYAGRASAQGVEHLIGDVWEWCDSGFEPYPDFEAYPYPEYSEVFFGGDYKMLRGGSWATRAGCAHASFRNWDHPFRRQIFAGIRLVRDVAPA